MAYYPTPQAVPPPEGTGEASEARVGTESREEDAGLERATESTEQGVPMELPASRPEPASEVRTSTATGLSCSPAEIEMAMAIAKEYAAAAASPVCATPSSALGSSTALPRPAAETAATLVAGPAPHCPSEPAMGCAVLFRVIVAIGGAFLGGLAVALWTRPRPLRIAQHR